MMFKKLLVAVDGSELGYKALEHAEALARATEGELVVLTVSDSESHATQHKRLGLFSDVHDNSTTQILNDILNIMIGSPVKYKLRSETGVPADVIISVAKQCECDAIVMGSRGLSKFTKLFIGSVSSNVINHAEVPVVIVK